MASSMLGRRDQRRVNGLVREADVAVRGAGPHLGSIRRQPRNFESRIEAGFGQHFAGQQDSLAAEAGHADCADRRVRAALRAVSGSR